MPDPSKTTISASQAAALVDKSPWMTRWMLWHWFKGTLPEEEGGDNRMGWGTRMEPLLIQAASEDLRLEVVPNEGDVYRRKGLFGCTADADIICPDRGPGSLEAKCVFDYATWMDKWDGGKRPPIYYELQLQVQMYVGGYSWGVIAAWCGADMFYFERKPDADLMSILEKRAGAFFADVAAGHEPDPFGVPVEVPLLGRLYPETRDEPLELDDYDLAEAARMMQWAAGEESRFKALKEKIRPRVLAAAKDHGLVLLPGDTRVTIKKSTTETTHVTPDMVGKVLRKGGVRNTINVWYPEEDT